jgi:hypothetical protein
MVSTPKPLSCSRLYCHVRFSEPIRAKMEVMHQVILGCVQVSAFVTNGLLETSRQVTAC